LTFIAKSDVTRANPIGNNLMESSPMANVITIDRPDVIILIEEAAKS
jgi:hypothetical protein